MDKICDDTLCTGCSLCASLCPHKSITMEPRESMGHLYPHINQSLCVDCGLCQKNCPVQHQPEKQRPQNAFAAWSKDDEDYITSTSGGVASVLSHYVLSKGGVVYGCAMLPDLEVKHIRVDKIENLRNLKGSKYVQSNIIEVIPQLKLDVKAGILVLFIGTPCQVAAINKLFKEQPQNLILIDLICHGVPSSKLLKEYVLKVAPRPHYDRVVFRDLQGKYVLQVHADGNIIYEEKLNRARYEGWYVSSFFEGFTYRNSCYNCQYARPERCSDITIGDFWGLGKKQKTDGIPEHNHGISVVLPATEKGEKLVSSIKSYLNIFKRPVDEAIEGNSQLNAPVAYNRRIRIFRTMYPMLGYNAYKLSMADVIVKNNIKSLLKK